MSVRPALQPRTKDLASVVGSPQEQDLGSILGNIPLFTDTIGLSIDLVYIFLAPHTQ